MVQYAQLGGNAAINNVANSANLGVPPASEVGNIGQRLSKGNEMFGDALNCLEGAIDRLLGARECTQTQPGQQVRGVPNGLVEMLNSHLDDSDARIQRLYGLASRLDSAI